MTVDVLADSGLDAVDERLAAEALDVLLEEDDLSEALTLSAGCRDPPGVSGVDGHVLMSKCHFAADYR
jgi:hypothetical protein